MSGPLMTSGLQPTPAVKAPVPVVKPAAGSTAAPAAPTLKAPAVAPKATMMGRDLERAWKVKLAAENAGAVVGLKTVQKGTSPWAKFMLLAYLHRLIDENHDNVPCEVYFKGCIEIKEGKERMGGFGGLVTEKVDMVKKSITDEELIHVYRRPVEVLTMETFEALKETEAFDASAATEGRPPFFVTRFRDQTPCSQVDREHLQEHFGRYKVTGRKV